MSDEEDEERRRRGIEALRTTAGSPTIDTEQRVFLLSVATILEGGGTVDFFDRYLVRRLLSKVVFG